MFKKLFKKPSVLFRHENAPYKEERERYLRHCEQHGYALSTLLLFARELLWVAWKLRIYPEHGVTLKQVKAVAQGWASRDRCHKKVVDTRYSRIHFIQAVRSWLRFLGYWREPERSSPFANLAWEFGAWMRDERGLTSQTIERRDRYINQFLGWYGRRKSQISDVCLKDIDDFLVHYGSKGNCRQSVKTMASSLRGFFRYAGSQGLCSFSIAQGIRGPRVFAQEHLPLGPSWEDVRRLIASMETDCAYDIRDKAMIMLLAIYGFRATEVSTLRLEDIDWEQNLISVSRVKRRGKQTYPLIQVVGNAIVRYLQKVRPPSLHREIFLTMTPPLRPFSRQSLYQVTSRRMIDLGIHAPHIGPHSLRHACAAHLVVEGFSIKEIGDHLGHRCSAATRIYAKVDLPSLREVAIFDLGGLI
jgi:site-specific recombinase XerD